MYTLTLGAPNGRITFNIFQLLFVRKTLPCFRYNRHYTFRVTKKSFVEFFQSRIRYTFEFKYNRNRSVRSINKLNYFSYVAIVYEQKKNVNWNFDSSITFFDINKNNRSTFVSKIRFYNLGRKRVGVYYSRSEVVFTRERVFRPETAEKVEYFVGSDKKGKTRINFKTINYSTFATPAHINIMSLVLVVFSLRSALRYGVLFISK